MLSVPEATAGALAWGRATLRTMRGVINSTIFRLTGADGPNWLNDPTLALSLSMVVHIWKSLPFWTLIFLAGRMAIQAGAKDFVVKPFQPSRVLEAVQRVLG